MSQIPLLPDEPGNTKYTPRHKLLPLRERPVERVSACANACTIGELLAALLGGPQPIETAEALLAHFHGRLSDLRRASAHEIAAIPGIGQGNAARVKAAVELGLRLMLVREEERPTIHSPADAAALLQLEMSTLEQEHLRVMLLDTRNRVIDVVEIYHGSLNSAQVRVAELFKPAIQRMAAAIILIHNHPSGDPTPSPDDVAVTRAVVQAGKLLDIDTLDHLVIGRARFVSLKERGLGFESGRVSETRRPYRVNEKPCTCSAYSFPHRKYGGKCQGPEYCAHGMRLPHYPDYDSLQDGYRQCDLESRTDEQFDRLHVDDLAVREDDDLIYSYTRAQAIADGVLIDVTQMASEAGFRYPTAITADLDVRLTPNEREQSLGQSYDGRLWDVLFLASFAARQLGQADRGGFEVSLFEAEATPPHRTHRSTLSLWMVIGPGDQGEPVITIGFPEDF
jgi:DNA repair protein RadC